MQIPVYARYTWWLKWYATVVITDEGVFAKDEVPEDYGGPQLTTEIIMRVVFATEDGYMWEHRYDDLTGVMDKTRKKGVGAILQPYSTVQPGETIDATGPSSHLMEWPVRENPAFSPVQAKLIAIATKALASLL